MSQQASVVAEKALPAIKLESSQAGAAAIWEQVMKPLGVAEGQWRIEPGSVQRLLAQQAEQAQAVIGQLEQWETTVADDRLTEHGLLVALGHFAASLGLLSGLAEVTIPQQQGVAHTPQEKVVQFLVGILGGIDYLQDFNEGHHPLVADEAVAAAWGQERFAHYSGVSRTLAAADETTLAELIGLLCQIGQPFIAQAVLAEMKRPGYLVADIDLAGRPVSPSSSDYLDSTFGHMDDGLYKGYQLALASLVCQPWQRLMVTGERYTGRTASAQCLQTTVVEMEQVLGVRPQ